MTTAQRKLLHLFEKPYESITQPRSGGTFVYKLDDEPVVETRVGEAPPTTVVPVRARPDANIRNLGSATSIPRGVAFSIFVKKHRDAAKDLCDAFMRTQGPDDLMEYAARVKDLVNESLFVYALSYTIVRKQELRNIRIPLLPEIFPNQFVPQEELLKTQAVANRMGTSETSPIVLEYGPEFTGTNIKPEHRVSYWREDYGFNSHHWHWHVVFPTGLGGTFDRKGEIFFYMHQQMLARYDMERLSVGLSRVEKLDNWRVVVPDGYFSKLTVNNTGRAWGSRQDDTLLKDVRRADLGIDSLDITDMENWRSRLMTAISQGFITDRNGEKVILSDNVTSGKRGIDILGDLVEADSVLTINGAFYGDIHNMGHVLISLAHDYNNAHREEPGVMFGPSTSARDPVFYRWHKFVDDIFEQYKLTQTPYTVEDLSLPDVIVNRASVIRNNEANTLTTGFSVREFETSRGLDFNSRVSMILRMTHMDSAPFDYHIHVTNNHYGPKEVTVRIFLAPKHNEQGLEMNFMEQRLLWSEMDKFRVTLKPGANHIVRASKDSTITNPNEFTFRDLEARPDTGVEGEEFDFCGCGWPQHLLLPRGKPEGMAYQLFYMLTDFEKDKVDQTEGIRACKNAVSFCGVLDAKFPDSRPMGFPFDRRSPRLLNNTVTSVADLAELDNIMLHDVTITFLNRNVQQ
ncbi:phenoloxidase 3-like [Panulirus ornatus]|uniref:phenoloxidase 3-like n=1 Tax=Panulirus ornatus TaxID=150431 RepID=UPI003A837180